MLGIKITRYILHDGISFDEIQESVIYYTTPWVLATVGLTHMYVFFLCSDWHDAR